MVLKDVQVSENFSVENHVNHATPTTTMFSRRRSYAISLTTLCLLAAFFLCTLMAVSFIIYNFATCHDHLTPGVDDAVVCTTVHLKNAPKSITTLANENEYESAITGSSNKFKHPTDLRLPRAIKPLKYNISIIPYLQMDNFSFEGEVSIRMLILENTKNITLHAVELNIPRNDIHLREVVAQAENVVQTELNIKKQYLLEMKQFFIIELDDVLKKDSIYELQLKFSGKIQDFLQGFYRSSYWTGNETRWIASTQFQATDARRAFPCFDEPALKANFTLNIARPANLVTVSNMPIIATKKADTPPNYVWDYFAESVPMSTYLVAYAISDFGHISDGNFSVWARKDALPSAQYALSIGPKILRFLEDFFDIKFALPKIDMIALPEFQAGAMENWGLITYRETTMLYEAGVSAATYKQHIATVVGHELTHQWFGNLVTPSWWTDLWLNEGFANYMEYLTVDAIEPSWKTSEQFIVKELQNVFQLDALTTSHKVSTEVHNPDEISEIFDRISYDKGAVIIRMIRYFLTEQVFRSGLIKYLKEMAYGAATQDDLWHAFTQEAVKAGLLNNNTSVKTIMDTWTLQVGFPILMVKRDPNSNIIRLEQERYMFIKTKNGSNNEHLLWWIPITYTTAKEMDFSKTRPLTWMPRTQIYEFEDRNLSTADWFIFNLQQAGYYRVNYEMDNWKALTNYLMDTDHYKNIAAPNRAQLIDDALNFARAGYVSYELALNLTQYLVHEDEQLPWKSALNAFAFIDDMLINQGDYDLWKNYILHLLSYVYDQIGFDDSNDKDDMLKLHKRLDILNMACRLGHRDCISESSRHFQNWLQVPNPDANNPISPNLRGLVYCTAIHYGTEFEWDFAFERYLKSKVPSEKELLLISLSCSREPWILSRYLRRAFAGNSIRKQDLDRVFAWVSSHAVGQQVAFNFIRNNWQDIKTYVGNSAISLSMIPKYVAKHMNTKFQLAEFETFIKTELKDSGRSVRQAVEQIQVNLDWMDRNYKTIIQWLKRVPKTTMPKVFKPIIES